MFSDPLANYVSDHDTLAAIAGSVGLPEDRAREILGSDTYVADVRAAEQMFPRSGINAVPALEAAVGRSK